MGGSMPWPELIVFFFLIAMIYASAGFGGGSSYLAILALYELPFTAIRATALLCNIAVVSNSVWLYAYKGLVPWRKALPLVGASVPMAFVGGMWPLQARTFYLLLGLALAAAALLMVWKALHPNESQLSKLPTWGSPLLGASIGLLSGMVGIGGGIFLAPVLHLTGWDTPKRIAATAAFFILVNSLAGFVGQILHPEFEVRLWFTIWLVAAVVAGGQIGTRLTIYRLSPRAVRGITAVLILTISIRLVIKHL